MLNRPHLLLQIVLVVSSATISLLFAEIFANYMIPRSRVNVYQFDPVLGHARIPQTSGTYTTPEFSTTVRFNNYGWRGGDIRTEKPPHTIRIAILGDSYIEGIQVEEDQLLSSKLEHYLTLKLDQKIKLEVLNAGCSGYGTTQELLLLQKKVLDFKPDLVVLGFLTANDIRNNSIELEQDTKDYTLAARPYFDRGSGTLHPPSITSKSSIERTGLGYAILNNLALARLIYQRIQQIHLISEVMLKTGLVSKTTYDQQNNIPTDYQVYSPDFSHTQVWDDAWWATEFSLKEMKRTLAEANIPLLVTILTNREQLYPEDWNAILSTYPNMQRHAWDLNLPRSKLKAILSENKLPVVDLFPPFKQFADNTSFPRLHYPVDGHWTPQGHELAAKLLAEEILPLIPEIVKKND